MSVLWPIVVSFCAFVVWVTGLFKNDVGALLLGMAGFVVAGTLWFVYGLDLLL